MDDCMQLGVSSSSGFWFAMDVCSYEFPVVKGLDYSYGCLLGL